MVGSGDKFGIYTQYVFHIHKKSQNTRVNHQMIDQYLGSVRRGASQGGLIDEKGGVGCRGLGFSDNLSQFWCKNV